MSFNSKLVRLKVKVSTSPPIRYFSFNSKLVRLKVSGTPNYSDYSPFQFQTGAIKRYKSPSVHHTHHRFNSKLVRLKVNSGFQIIKRVCPNRFNSKLVRLKECIRKCQHAHKIRFNSKLVRLKARLATKARFHRLLFQFQTGAIKSHTLDIRRQIVKAVSIPNWCD